METGTQCTVVLMRVMGKERVVDEWIALVVHCHYSLEGCMFDSCLLIPFLIFLASCQIRERRFALIVIVHIELVLKGWCIKSQQ